MATDQDQGTGRFLPGNQVGRSGSARNRISRLMADQFQEHMDRTGEAANPLICLARIMADTREKSAVRAMCAAALTRALIPKKLEVSRQDEGAILRADRMVVMLQSLFPPAEPKQVESQ